MRTLHAIRAWDAGSGEDPLCGLARTVTFHGDLTNFHEYVTCAACRAHPAFDADRNEEPWPLPETIAESTAQLHRRNERRAGGAA